MKRVFLTIVLIVIASSIYIGYKWATFDHEGKDNDTGNESAQSQEVEASDSKVYDQFWSNLVNGLSERSHLLLNEDDFHLMGFNDNVSLFSMNGDNLELSVTSHSYEFDDQGKAKSSMFYDFYDVEEDYDLSEDIKGIITLDKDLDEYSFMQTNQAINDNPIMVTIQDLEHIEDFKEVLDNLDIPEQKEYTEDEFIDLIDIEVNDLLAFNLDQADLELRGFDIFKYRGKSDLMIFYKATVDEEDISVHLQIEKDPGMDREDEAIELDNGRTIYLIDSSYPVYYFTDSGYRYEISFTDADDIDQEAKESLLEHLNVPLLSE